MLYIAEQLFASVSVNSGGYLPRLSGSVNIHRYSPPRRRIIFNYERRGKGSTTIKDNCGCRSPRPGTSFAHVDLISQFPLSHGKTFHLRFFHPQELLGNADNNTVVKQELDPPIVARFLRIYPLEYHQFRTLRLELYGCNSGQ